MFANTSTWLGLQTLDWVILAAYFLTIFMIGIWSLRRVKDSSDFFMGGRRFGKIFMMFFAFGSGTSSEQAVGVVAGTWRVGLAGIWWQFLWLWATPFYWIVAPVMRRMRALTTADFFEARFSSSTALLYSIYGIIMSIVFIAGGLYGSGKMVDELTNNEIERMAEVWDVQVPELTWDSDSRKLEVGSRKLRGFEYAVLAMTVLFVTYGMVGGLGAAIITDFIQGILTVTFSFLLLPFVFRQIGGFGKLHSEGELKENMFDLFVPSDVAEQMATTLNVEPITWYYVVMLSLMALAGIVVQPHIMGVCGAGKTEMEGRFGFTFGNFLKRFCTIAWTFTGLACIVWYLGSNSPLPHADQPQPGTAEYQELPEAERLRIEADRAILPQLKSRISEDFAKLPAEEQTALKQADKDFADRLFGRAAYDVLPKIAPGLIGLLLASLLAAIMSTSDAQMVVSSGLFTENIYRKYLVKNKSDRHYLWVGRLSGLVIVLLALVLMTTFKDVIDALKYILDTPAIIGISLWIGIVWRGWTPAAVWVSTIFGGAAWAACKFFPSDLMEMGLPETMFNTDGDVTHFWRIVFYLSAGILSGFITSLMTKRVDEEKLDAFFRLIHTPVMPGEVVDAPCTLPKDAPPPNDKLLNLKDIEIGKPTFIGMGGFIAAWICVGLIIWLTSLLARIL